MPDTENDRQYRVLTQMISMYSMLRDRYRRRDFWLNVVLIVVSISLNAFVFASDDAFTALGLPPGAARTSLKTTSVVALILSIIRLKVDWQGMAKSYSDASERLGLLKAKYREGYEKVAAGDRTIAEQLSQEYARAMEGLARIPETQFNALKARHEFKVRLSARISQYPTSPAWLLHILMRADGMRAAFRSKNVSKDPEKTK